MVSRPPILLAVLAAALALGARPAAADTELGSANPGAAPTGFACAGTCQGAAVGFRQLALAGAVVEAPEDGVLVSARVYARRSAGSAPPSVVVLRPGAGLAATIVGRAPVPGVGAAQGLREVQGLHLPVQAGDTLGFLLRPGEVDLGVRSRPSPDGAVVRFGDPCAPCGADGGTGRELLLAGTVEPDDDGDLLGDETQDPDRGGLGDEEPFEEDRGLFDDEFADEDLEDGLARPERRRRLRLLRVLTGRNGVTRLVLRPPGPGRLTAVAGTLRNKPVATAGTRVFGTARVRLRLVPTAAGRRLLARRGPLRVRLRATHRSPAGRRQALTRRLALGAARPRRRSEGDAGGHRRRVAHRQPPRG
jgi:hypothetical protein